MAEIVNKRKIIELKDLTLAFGEVEVLHNLSFTLHRNEILGIVGESGSGKSLTSLSIMGLLNANAIVKSGEITFWNKSGHAVEIQQINKQVLNRLRRSELSMIFQEPMTALNPVYTCGFQLREVLKHSGLESPFSEAEWLQKVGIKDPQRILRSYPHQISGGQKQRVMIAMALAKQPKLLIADEPTTALDAQVRRSILDLIKQLSQEFGLSVLFISHDMDAVQYISDRILVMKKGLLVEQAETTKLLTNPQKQYTKGLIACKPPLHKSLHLLPTLEQLQPQQKETKTSTENLEPILEVKNLVVEYKSTQGILNRKTNINRAVNQVSFSLLPGKTLGIIGESGSGKSTIGNAILKFIQPTAGEILFNSKDITTLKTAELKKFREQVQVIQQDPYSALNPRQKIGESIREPLIVHQKGNKTEQKKKVYELLELVQLSKTDYHKYPHQFSGGQRQRICIARALTLNPKLIICDESVSALDLSVQASVLNLLKELQEQLHLSYLFITHDLAVARFIADDILVLQHGSVQEYGPSAEIIDKPKAEYTKNLIEQVAFK